MPPRTGPRRKKRTPRQAAVPLRRYCIIRNHDGDDDIIVAWRVELVDGNLVFRDDTDAVTHILAEGEWRDVHPATADDLPLPAEIVEPDETDIDESREQATLVGEADLVLPKEEPESRFVPSSPEEAQRILMEMERRLKPEPAKE